MIITLQPLDLDLLSVDVTLVLGLYLDLLQHRLVEILRKFGTQLQHLINAEFGSANEVQQADFPRNRAGQDWLDKAGARRIGSQPVPPQQSLKLRHRRLLGIESPPPLVAYQSQLVAHRRQATVGVVLAQQQPIFGATGEHPVRFHRTPRNQIVDHDPNVGLAPARCPGLAIQNPERGIETRNQPLSRRLLVTRRAIDLAGKVETRQGFGLQAGMQITGIEVIVFDRIPWPRDMRLLEPPNRTNRPLLHIKGQTR